MRRPSPFTLAAVVIASGLVINLATDTIQIEAPWWGPAVWAALAVLFVVVVRIESTRVPESTVDLGQAADDLAEAVESQWRTEVNARGFGHLDPIRVRWSATSRPVTPAPAELLDAHQRPAPPVKVTRLRLSGDLADMTRTLAQLPIRQLVVIGSPGAGKSTLAVVLTLALIKGRQTGDPVPVLMTVSSWDPDREYLDAWLIRRLGELYPALSHRGRYGTDAAARLVDRGLVTPILDGLDEMPGPVQAKAIGTLTVAVGRDRSLVLTSRADEYEAAVLQVGSPLARAAVVEIEPVTAADAAAFLTAGQIDGEVRWQMVLEHLAVHPDGPLARTLRTPLMVYLARTAYHTPGSDPAALLAFTDPVAIERHLLDAYLPALYAPRTPSPSAQHALGTVPNCTVQQACRWLAFLANHMTHEQTADLTWWRLHRAMPLYSWRMGGLIVGIFVGLPAALMVGFMIGLVVALVVQAGYETAFRVGFTAAWQVGLMVTAVIMSRVIDTPQQIQINPKLFVHRLIVHGLIGGVALWLVLWLLIPLGLGSATSVGPAGSAVHGFGVGFMVGLVEGLVGGLGASATLTEAVTPRTTLINDRKFSVLFACAVVVFAVLAEAMIEVVGGVAATSMRGLMAALMGGLVFMVPAGSWLRFVVARLLFATRRQLPIGLMSFLNDAYRLGVLRQVGAVYQFRHARLQEHLATLHRTNP